MKSLRMSLEMVSKTVMETVFRPRHSSADLLWWAAKLISLCINTSRFLFMRSKFSDYYEKHICRQSSKTSQNKELHFSLTNKNQLIWNQKKILVSK